MSELLFEYQGKILLGSQVKKLLPLSDSYKEYLKRKRQIEVTIERLEYELEELEAEWEDYD